MTDQRSGPARDAVTARPTLVAATDAGPDPATGATGIERQSAERLRLESLRFLRRFGLVSAAWSVLLAATAPTVADPAILWVGVGAAAGWAIASQWVTRPRAWWLGWVVATIVLEWTGPLAGTDGWSVTGGAVVIVLFGVALSGSRRRVALTTTGLVLTGLVRPFIGHGWPIGRAATAALFITFGAIAMTWLIRAIERVVVERDRLQAQLLDARTEAARANERAEAGARLHDTVLQHLAAVTHATDVSGARRHAGRASNELRQFLRSEVDSVDSLRQALQEAVTAAADGVDISVSVVGDRDVGDRELLLVAATSEAVRNAVHHGSPPIRVHAELARAPDGDTVVWVADQGPGFELATVPGDRLGVRRSIIDRMHRAGGRAHLVVDDTTEWELRMPGAGHDGPAGPESTPSEDPDPVPLPDDSGATGSAPPPG